MASSPSSKKTIGSLVRASWTDQTSPPVVPAPVYLPGPTTIEATQSFPSMTAVETRSSLEKGEFTPSLETHSNSSWEGYENETLPPKTHPKLLRDLRHIIFSLYRRLFGIVFCVNMSILIATMVQGGANTQQLGQIVVANLFCAILMRQDYVINAFFNTFCAVPPS